MTDPTPRRIRDTSQRIRDLATRLASPENPPHKIAADLNEVAKELDTIADEDDEGNRS